MHYLYLLFICISSLQLEVCKASFELHASEDVEDLGEKRKVNQFKNKQVASKKEKMWGKFHPNISKDIHPTKHGVKYKP